MQKLFSLKTRAIVVVETVAVVTLAIVVVIYAQVLWQQYQLQVVSVSDVLKLSPIH